MALKNADTAEVLQLPSSLVNRVDALRLLRELELSGSIIEQQAHHGAKTAAPQMSANLQAISQLNQLDLSQAGDRDRLRDFLKGIKNDAPTIHMSFASEPPSVFTAKLINWLRQEVHPMILLDVGLQPTIAAGCIIRTNSKYFDCSMRQHLVANKPKLLELMRGAQYA